MTPSGDLGTGYCGYSGLDGGLWGWWDLLVAGGNVGGAGGGPAVEQADCGDGAGKPAAGELGADLDGGVSGRALCGDGERGLWDVRVEV